MLNHPLRYRMAIALLALVAAMVALYLHLWKLGLAGELSCTGGGGCMVAQMSSYGWFPTPDTPITTTCRTRSPAVMSPTGG